MKCSVFIITSIDEFIARKEGSIDWLQTAGNLTTQVRPTSPI
ncbi:hypothetical protein [Photobacterium iliopiscarium]|nr:hypothetical protein [Photobacterium iliopiscarium]